MLLELAAIDDHIDKAVILHKLGALESLRQVLADGLLDDTRTGKTDKGAGLGDDDVAQHGKTGRGPARGRVGEDGEEGDARFREQRELG